MTALSVLPPSSTLDHVRERVSPEEWAVRVKLAAAYRLAALFRWTDHIYTHFSARVPGPDEHFLINAYGLLYEEITASSLLKIDHEGNILAKPEFNGGLEYGVNRAGFVIHSAIHMAKPEVGCVIHTHTWPGMAVSSLECGLLPMNQTAMRFLKIGYHDYQGVVLNTEEQASLLADLGDGEAVMFRNHGALVVGRSVGEAFNWMHRLELACRAQIGAMSCNTPLQAVPQHVLEETWNNYQPGTRRPYGLMEWPALLRKLDRMDPSFRT